MRVLRVCILAFISVATASVFCLYLRAAENQPPAAKSPGLSQRVAALEEKVAQLEKKLAAVTQPGYPVPAPSAPVPPGAIPAQPLPQAAPSIPPNAVPHTFNGQTYYIVPLGKEAAR
jgi:hypothetical protein